MVGGAKSCGNCNFSTPENCIEHKISPPTIVKKTKHQMVRSQRLALVFGTMVGVGGRNLVLNTCFRAGKLHLAQEFAPHHCAED